ncbi:MAG: undecaprenyl-diphosphate phosphatase [Anaerovoracaceae bacterium]
MTLIESMILGLVQGLAEFLPISSSGHLAVLQHMFGVDTDNVLMFTVMLHFGTLISIFFAYRHDIWDLLKELFALIKDIVTGQGIQMNKNETRRLGIMIVIATIPTAIIGLLFNDLFESFYSNITFIGVSLIITGTGLFFAENKGGGDKGVMEMSIFNALLIGVCQAIAICPGISRSGATMIGGLASRFERAHAVRFAFLISIPSVLGAFLMELSTVFKHAADGSGISLGIVLAGITVAAISGYFAIKIMIKAVTDKKLIYFSFYTWIVGALLVGYSILV